MNEDCMAASKREREREERALVEQKRGDPLIYLAFATDESTVYRCRPTIKLFALWKSHARSKARTLIFKLCFTNFFVSIERTSSVHSIIRWYITIIILPDCDCLVVPIKYFPFPCPSNFTRKTVCLYHLRKYKRTQWDSSRRTNLYVLYIFDGTPSSFSRFSRTILVLDSIWRLKIFFPRVFVPPPRRPRLRSAFRGVITRRARPLPPLALSVPRDRNILLFYKDARRACERTSERARARNTTKTCREKSRTRPPSRLDNGNAETSRGNVTMIEARPPREIYLAISRGLHERAPPSWFPAAPTRDWRWYFIRRNFYYEELYTLYTLVL